MKNMESKNPFDPNFGKVPQIYLGRDKLVENVVESLEDGTGLFFAVYERISTKSC
ncbi:hypothetical protein [Lactobacillus paragasseri]|nr:hypothetical protein [Lactobacillus paragasseri]